MLRCSTNHPLSKQKMTKIFTLEDLSWKCTEHLHGSAALWLSQVDMINLATCSASGHSVKSRMTKLIYAWSFMFSRPHALDSTATCARGMKLRRQNYGSSSHPPCLWVLDLQFGHSASVYGLQYAITEKNSVNLFYSKQVHLYFSNENSSSSWK